MPHFPPILLAQLVQPDVGVLGNQHQPRHPVLVWAETLWLAFKFCQSTAGPLISWDHRWPRPHERLLIFFLDQVQAAQQPVKIPPQHLCPAGADEFQLVGQGIGVCQCWRPQHINQVLIIRPVFGLGFKIDMQFFQRPCINRLRLQPRVIK